MSGIDGLGEAVTGGMLARAVEPKAGGAVPAHGNTCLNCGAALVGEYCHRCGQGVHVHRSLHSFAHDLAHGVLHFEGKTWRTLPMLAFKPGDLTRRYIAGERAKFVSPMALFLFTVFLMFAVIHSVGGPFGSTHFVDNSDKALTELQKERVARLQEVRNLEARLAAAKQQGKSTEQLNSAIREARAALVTQDKAYKATEAIAGKPWVQAAERSGPTVRLTKSEFRTGFAPLDQAILKAANNPDLLLYKMQSNAYKFSWALIPISAPFIWLLFFWKRQYKLYDHTVFVTYSIAFMSFGVIVLSLLRPLGLSGLVAGLAILLVPPFHMYRQLKGAYGLTRAGALLRTFFLLIFAFVAGIFFFSLLLALGALD